MESVAKKEIKLALMKLISAITQQLDNTEVLENPVMLGSVDLCA